jgi:hypothetical protein
MIGDFLVKLFSHKFDNFTLSRPGFLPLLERVLLDFTHVKSFNCEDASESKSMVANVGFTFR